MTWSLPKALPDLSSASMIAIDVETYDPDLGSKGPGARREGYLVGIAVGVPDGGRWYLPFDHAEGVQFDREKILEWARRELCRDDQPKVGANLLYDLDYLYEAGVPVTGPFFDVQIAEPLLDENRRRYSLDALAVDYLGEGKDEAVLEDAVRSRGLKGKPQKHIWQLPPSLVGQYAEADVDRPLRIIEIQRKRLWEQGLDDLFNLETRLVPLLLAMRRRGVRINVDAARLVRDDFRERLAVARERLDKIAGQHIDYWAARSIADAFDQAGLNYPLTPKTKAPSFKKDFLEAHDHPIAAAVIECRKVDKFIGTFIEGSVLSMLVGDRIHCEFHQLRGDQYGTVSGRFSSSNPNLQFIPVRDEELGPLIRSIFVPEPGEKWGRADYSQIELRILAHYAIGRGSNDMRDAYQNDPDADYHQICADKASIDRTRAKRVNFAVVYGSGTKTTAAQLGMTFNDAKVFLDEYHRALPFIRETARIASKRAERRGWIKTILGRLRRFDLWEPADWQFARTIAATTDRQEMAKIVQKKIADAVAEGKQPPRGGVRRARTYKALNALIQGSAADLMKKAMVDVWESGVCDVLGAPLLTVHDELDVSIPRGKIGREAFDEMVRIMADAIPLKVPVLVDSSIGDNWGECK